MADSSPERMKERYDEAKKTNPNLDWDTWVKIWNKQNKTDHPSTPLEENKSELTDPEKIIDNYIQITEGIQPLIDADKKREAEAREGYKEEARQDVTTDMPGLTPNQRRQLQQSANSQINKQVQSYKRSMSSNQGRRGVRGGAAFAQQAEIARQGMDAQNQFQRDLVEKDTDLAMRRLAAYLAQVEGRTAQDILRTGQYFDYLTGKQQQGKQEAYKNYYDNLFSGMKK